MWLITIQVSGKIVQFQNIDRLNHQKLPLILTNDASNDIVHVTNREGNFLQHREYLCDGGLSNDREHNLVVNDVNNGRIIFIKYLH